MKPHWLAPPHTALGTSIAGQRYELSRKRFALTLCLLGNKPASLNRG
jgi:hypothetical protein